MNRRGSKSEGRINITVQDRLAETERLKKECVAKTVAAVAIAPARSVFDGICNVKVLTASDLDPNRLGRGVRSIASHKMMPRPLDLKCGGGVGDSSSGPQNDAVFQTIIEPPSPNPIECKPKSQNGERAFSVDSAVGAGAAGAFNTAIETRFLTDSSTITIPIGSTSSPVQLVNPPKYKTMPSPTRANTILPGAPCLNEIYEEGTDIGSSDTSTTTTPRPIARHTNFMNQRAASAHQSGSNGSGSPATAGATHAHRRNKFHKSRTASCSSSDDDDSENRKKRAHKIVDSTKPFQTQRRDSNDDSSDSQDPGGNPACGGAGAGATGFSILTSNGNETETTGDQPNADDTDSTHTNDSSNSNGRQKSIQQGFRRHRHTGRRRTGETRLRESQSLNRITEVQESEMPILNTLQMPNRSPATLSTGAIDHDDNPQSPTASTHSSVLLGTSTAAATSQQTHKATKLGFGARLLQGFKKSDSNSKGNSGSGHHHHHEPKTKHNNNNNHKNNNNWNGSAGGGGGGGNHISSADSNETLHWIKHSKPPLRVKAHQRLKNLKCLVDIFS